MEEIPCKIAEVIILKQSYVSVLPLEENGKAIYKVMNTKELARSKNKTKLSYSKIKTTSCLVVPTNKEQATKTNAFLLLCTFVSLKPKEMTQCYLSSGPHRIESPKAKELELCEVLDFSFLFIGKLLISKRDAIRLWHLVGPGLWSSLESPTCGAIFLNRSSFLVYFSSTSL